MMRYALIGLLAVFAAACGDSNPYHPAGPASVIPPLPPPRLKGQWGGSLSITVGSQRQSGAVIVRLEQSGSTIAGWWSNVGRTDLGFLAGSGTRGDITGTVTPSGTDLQFSGTVTWESASADGGTCRGQGAFTGRTQGGNAILTMSAPSVPLAGCQALSNFTISAEVIGGSA